MRKHGFGPLRSSTFVLAACIFAASASAQNPAPQPFPPSFPPPRPAQKAPAAKPAPGQPAPEARRTHEPAAEEPGDGAYVTKIYRLKYARAGEMEETLGVLGTFGGKVAVDARTNSVIVVAPQDRFPAIEELIREMDVPGEAPEPEPGAKQVRLVWLFSGQEGAGKAPPADLAKVIGELGKYGLVDLQMVTQLVIRTNAEGSVSITSNPMLGKTPCNLRLQGSLTVPKPDLNKVQITLSVSSQMRPMPAGPGLPPGAPAPGAPPPVQVLSDITSTISLPAGHPVVFCSVPVENMTSVFVFEVIAP